MQGLPALGSGLTVNRSLREPLRARLAGLDWSGIARELWDRGHAVTPALVAPGDCRELAAVYDDDGRFRSRVDMARYRFGEGEYKYFADPLPPVVADLRAGVYPHLAPVASQWMAALGSADCYPDSLDEFLDVCHRHGQTRPTPLLLRYGPGGYNCLHQDLYGPVVFPFQMTIVLSRPGADFEGGEFLLVEQRPRAQSRAEVVPLGQGDAVIFTTRFRPAPGARGTYRAAMRHGVSRVRAGSRMSLGVIFHDAA